jgi:general secretion pathway protein J
MSLRIARRFGFTLLEVLIAIAMTAFIGTVIAVSFNTSIGTKEVTESQAERYRMLRTAFARMEREVAGAYVSDRYDPKRFRDAFDRPTNFVGAKDKLLFTSLAHQRLYADAKESDEMVVEYSVKRALDTKVRDRQDLVRREKALLDDRMERGGTEDTLLEGVKRVEFAYWDSQKRQWESEWDTRRIERKSTLPTRVKMTVFAIDESGKETKYSTQTRVMLNTEFPRYQ